MSGTLISFCLMALGARELSGEIPVFQTLFFRSAIGLVLISSLILLLDKKQVFRSERGALHTFRNTFHFFGQYGWFVGIGLLPLAEVFALEFTVPIWTAIIASLFLGERMTPRKAISIFLGMLGVVVIVRPGIEIIDAASLIVLGAAICYAISYTTTKSLASTESPLTILFYMCLVQLPVSLLLSLSVWVWPEGIQWFWFVVIGVTALSAHFCLVRAMGHAEVTTVITLDFLRLPLIAVLGVLLYNEEFELYLLIGGALMLLGNWINFSELAMRGRSR
ncbi:EamA family transporter [Gammaproteobacteria bacterium 42_54_T18]|nr:EamA family transporter [Gammaproteobacteria bacterium 42_54_T18]